MVTALARPGLITAAGYGTALTTVAVRSLAAAGLLLAGGRSHTAGG